MNPELVLSSGPVCHSEVEVFLNSGFAESKYWFHKCL